MQVPTTAQVQPSTASGDVQALSEALRAATTWLELNRERINRLNVFPVPDGDTGDNMVLTMRAAVQSLDSAGSASLAEVCDAIAEGSLNGSRGNSGVILSQMLAGFTEELRTADEVSPRTLSAAFNRAAEHGRKAHSKPAEGTMITVAHDLACASTACAENGLSVPDFLAVICDEARASVARTPSLLPLLKQAGVVDAGGEGLAVLVEGALRQLRGEPMGVAPVAVESDPDFGSLDLPEEDVFGYCTNFMVRGEGMDVDAFRETVLTLGRSALVIGHSGLIKVHVHTEQPGEILGRALALGTLHQIKLENMDDQYQQVLQAKPSPRAAEPVTTALVAVTAGSGFVRLFENDLRATVVPGGQSMNPSTGDLISAIDRALSEHVILIPNNPNVIMSAQKAAQASKKTVRVLPTKSSPVGMVAGLAYSPEVDLDVNFEAMHLAVAGAVGIEVTRAVRDAEIEGIKVREGEYIALVDDRLVAAETELSEVVVAALERAEVEEKELLTIYQGAEARAEELEAVTEALAGRWPDLEVEVQQGGQPHYVLVASLE